MVATKLGKEGYEVAVASNSTEASTKIEEKTPDFILLDLLLPGGTDGFGILKKIRENTKLQSTPVIVFSNLAEDKDIARAK